MKKMHIKMDVEKEVASNVFVLEKMRIKQMECSALDSKKKEAMGAKASST